MKKIVALILCMMMVFTLSLSALAATDSPTAGTTDKEGNKDSESVKTGDVATTALSVTALAALAVAVAAKKREA